MKFFSSELTIDTFVPRFSDQDGCLVVSFPDRIFRARRKNGSGQLPIPFSFKCAGMLAHCSFLI